MEKNKNTPNSGGKAQMSRMFYYPIFLINHNLLKTKIPRRPCPGGSLVVYSWL